MTTPPQPAAARPASTEPHACPARRWFLRVIAAAICVSALVAGCGLPKNGPVQQGLDVGSPLLPPVRFQFEAPPRGASAEQIVRGFLAASWSSDDDFRAARAYLTPNASQAWNPRLSVTVYPDSSSLQVSVDSSVVELRTSADATLDVDGRYTTLPANATRNASLQLSQVSGEWRISHIPPDFGLWLSRFYFERAYRSFTISYADLRLKQIVVDPRWFPVGAGLATKLARAQLQEPPAYLRGAVRSGFPPGTNLAVDSVPIEGGRAEIDLSPAVLNVSADERRAAWAQSLATMRQVPDVSTVALRVSGKDIEVVSTGQPGLPPMSLGDLGYSYGTSTPDRALLRTGTRLTAVDAGDVTSRDASTDKASQTRLPDIAAGWSWLAASADVSDLAAVGGDRRDLHRWRAGEEGTVQGVGTQLVPPSYDVRGTLWSGGVDAGGSARIWAIDAAAGLGAQARPLEAKWLEGRTLEQVRPAPDGVRMLVVTRNAQGLQIGVSGIVRDGAGKPRALTEPWAIGGDVEEVTAAAWASNETVALIGRRAGGPAPYPLLVAVGGPTTPLAAVPDARRIVVTTGERGIVILSGNGHAYSRVGGGWQQLGEVDDIIMPGS